MGPMLPSSGSFGIKLVDNDYHDELRTFHSGRGGKGRKNPRYDSVCVRTSRAIAKHTDRHTRWGLGLVRIHGCARSGGCGAV